MVSGNTYIFTSHLSFLLSFLLLHDINRTLSPQIASEATNQVEVVLCHKPRGCKGIWQKVEPKNALRVTKGKGKWLKLEIKAGFPFKASDIDIFLLDISTTEHPELIHCEDEGITIESTTESTGMECYMLEVELKLDRVCKRLQFWVTVRTTMGILKAKSVEFGAHNNGKVRYTSNSLSIY